MADKKELFIANNLGFILQLIIDMGSSSIPFFELVKQY